MRQIGGVYLLARQLNAELLRCVLRAMPTATLAQATGMTHRTVERWKTGEDQPKSLAPIVLIAAESSRQQLLTLGYDLPDGDSAGVTDTHPAAAWTVVCLYGGVVAREETRPVLESDGEARAVTRTEREARGDV